MNILIVTESCFGNTARVAEAVAAGIESKGDAVTIADAASHPDPSGADLLLVGAPTHNMGLPGPGSRKQARNKGGHPEDTGVAEWLEALPRSIDGRAAAFDTVTGTGIFSGSAAKHIDKRLRRRGMTIVDRKSFLVGGLDGPVAKGELERAEAWGASLV